MMTMKMKRYKTSNKGMKIRLIMNIYLKTMVKIHMKVKKMNLKNKDSK